MRGQVKAANRGGEALKRAALGYLLDTSAISALALGRENHLTQETVDWFHTHDAQLFLPSIAIAELAQGIAKLSRNGSVERARRLEVWLNNLVQTFGDRVLPFDATLARLVGKMSDAAIAIGRHPGFADVAIAATGQHYELIVLTRNLKHFQPLGVACADPFDRGL